MFKRLMIYAASLFGGTITWIALILIRHLNPTLPWDYPFLAPVLGMTFPGGATPSMYFVNHVVTLWCPILVAYLIARLLTRKRARFTGALILYVAFIVWSGALLWLDQRAVVSMATLNRTGLIGAVIGGAFVYLWFIDPKPTKRAPNTISPRGPLSPH